MGNVASIICEAATGGDGVHVLPIHPRSMVIYQLLGGTRFNGGDVILLVAGNVIRFKAARLPFYSLCGFPSLHPHLVFLSFIFGAVIASAQLLYVS